LRFGTTWMQRQGLDFGRWRFQRFIALLARKRVESKLKQAEKEGRPYDAIAFHTQTAAFACVDLMAKVPALVSTDITNAQASREWNIPASRWTYWPSIRWERAVFRQARAIATFSEWAQDAVLAENSNLNPGQVRHYPPGVELEKFLAIPMARPARDKCRLLFVGGDFERKGGTDLVACFRESLRETCELHIVSAGAPVGLEEEGIHVYRDLKPYSPELLACYREADIFVLPTRNEAYGHVFIEAMAAGLPVVATDINAIPGILAGEMHRFLIAPGDRQALRDAVLALQSEATLRVALGEAGRKRAIAEFDATTCLGRYVAWLKEIGKKKS
jgi:starch synthase